MIITGMSGSGKASVLKAFEDLGYYCVDNLPVGLILPFAELVAQSSEIERTALVVDVREGKSLEEVPEIVKSVKRILANQNNFSGSVGCGPAAPFQRDPPSRIRWGRMRPVQVFSYRRNAVILRQHPRDRGHGNRHFEI